MNRILLASAFLLVSISAAFADGIPSAVPTAVGSVPAAVSPAPKASAPKLVEPHLHIARSNLVGHARIALTFDAC
ncbi:polysaccharide deacetylase, partial [Rhizobium ruizarguesonis]